MLIRDHTIDEQVEFIRDTLDWHETEGHDQGLFYISAYELDRVYGGPEEGDWWYNIGTPKACIPIFNKIGIRSAVELIYYAFKRAVDEQREYTSVLGGYDINVQVDETFAEFFPQEAPRYE